MGFGMRAIVRNLLAFVFMLLPPKLGLSATIAVLDPDGIAIVLVQGLLTASDATEFQKKTGPLFKAIVMFESDGGSIVAGIQIGEIIRLKNFVTLVPNETRCASACAIAWLGGIRRLMGPGARIGFHAAYDASSGQETGVGNALVGAYLSRIGLPYSAVIYITQATPNSMTWLSLSEAEQRGIEVSLLETPDKRRKATATSSNELNPAHADLQQRAVNFVLSVIEQWSGSANLSLRFLSSVYPTQVEYYGSLKDRDAVVKDKQKFTARWPLRKYIVRSDTISTQCDPATSSCDVRGILDWQASSEKRKVISSGSAKFDYKVRLTDDGFLILAETGSTLSRQTGKIDKDAN
jgi:ATP-dependent protease ClpP protease subunit